MNLSHDAISARGSSDPQAAAPTMASPVAA